MSLAAEWVGQMLFMAVLLSCFKRFAGDGKNKKYISIIAGMLMVLTVLSPVIKVLGGSSYYNSLKRYLNNSLYGAFDLDFEEQTNADVNSLFEYKLNNELKELLYRHGYGIKNIVYTYADEKSSIIFENIDVTIYKNKGLNEKNTFLKGQESTKNTSENINVEMIEIKKIIVDAGENKNNSQKDSENKNSNKQDNEINNSNQTNNEITEENIKEEENNIKSIIADFYNVNEMHINVNILNNNEGTYSSIIKEAGCL